jgi:hypothetical protein
MYCIYIINILALHLLSFEVIAVNHSELPYHAFKKNNETWECNSGFYKTSPKISFLSTCKRCSSINTTQCPNNALLVPCTLNNDAFCSQCDDLPTTRVYTPNTHDCLTIRCHDGFFNDSLSSECISCPMGSYCLNGEKKECGDRHVTLSVEEISPLSCIPLQKNDTWQIQLTFFFSLRYLSLSTETISFCPYKREMVSAWLKYGKIIECIGKIASTNEYDGEIKCVILTSRLYTIDYMQWLDNEFNTRLALIYQFLQFCLQRNDIYSLNIRLLSSASNMLYDTNTSSQNKSQITSDDIVVHPPIHTPELSISNKKIWGSVGSDIGVYIFSVTILFCSICMSVIIISTGFILRIRKNEIKNKIHLNQKTLIRGILL